MWIGLAGIGALLAFARRRRAPGPPGEPSPADELKRKLAEAREAAADRDEFEGAETPVDRVEPSVDERRREVHEAARAVIDDRD
jgi:hypothetical protein